MFNFYYPENNEKFPIPDFGTKEAALEYWRDKRWSWEEIDALGPNDLAEFISPHGEIVVLREVTAEKEQS